jgi:hypothetical protein
LAVSIGSATMKSLTAAPFKKAKWEKGKMILKRSRIYYIFPGILLFFAIIFLLPCAFFRDDLGEFFSRYLTAGLCLFLLSLFGFVLLLSYKVVADKNGFCIKSLLKKESVNYAQIQSLSFVPNSFGHREHITVLCGGSEIHLSPYLKGFSEFLTRYSQQWGFGKIDRSLSGYLKSIR